MENWDSSRLSQIVEAAVRSMHPREVQLIHAVEADDTKLVEQLLVSGADGNVVKVGGLPLVMYVKSVGCLRLLARFQVNLMATDSMGWTALHRAGRSPNELAAEWIRFLGTPDVRDTNGETPLYFAVRFKEVSFAKLLLENGANPNVINNDGDPAIHIAAQAGDRKMIQLLLDYGALVDMPNAQNDTALMIAAYHDRWFSETVVDLLLSYGASPQRRASIGWNAVENARATKSMRAIKLLMPYATDGDREHGSQGTAPNGT